MNPNNSSSVRNVSDAKDAAQSVWQQVHVLSARTVTEIDTAFATVAQEKVGALVSCPIRF